MNHSINWYKNIYESAPCVSNCIYGALCYGGCVMDGHICKKENFEELLPIIIEDKIKEYYGSMKKQC